MIVKHKQKNTLQDIKINPKMRLAMLWTSLMFLYIYVDYFHLYMPNSLMDLSDGKVFVFDISQTLLLMFLFSVTIPSLMIFLSVTLSANANRWANLIVATIYIPFTLFNLVGDAWLHMVFGAVVEVSLLLLVIRHAWCWPRVAIQTTL